MTPPSAKQPVVRDVLGINSVVYVYQYYLGGTFDDVIVRRNIEKAIPEAMAELN